MFLPNASSAGVLLTLALLLGSGPGWTEGGADDLVVVVSAANPVRQLSRQEVADLFLGRSRQFPDGNVVVPVDQPEGTSIREAFNSVVLGRSAAQVRSHWAKIIFTGRGRPPQALPDGEAVKQLMAGNPRVIGYIHRSLVDDRVAVVAVD